MAYLRQQTWLENGPRIPAGGVAIPVPRLATPALDAWRSRGMGFLSTDYCASYWSLLDPRAWVGGCIGPDAGAVYQKIQYGTAPKVVTPPAPTISLGVPASTPGAVYAGDDASGAPVYALPSTAAENQQALIEKQNAAIDAAAAAGWNPAGNLPTDILGLSDFWNKYGTPLMIAGALVGGLVLVGKVRR